MADCCATPPKINNLFTKFRKELLPDIMKNWENLSNDQQQSLGNVNEFFCGLHFLVGLADQAEACLKVWKKIFKGKMLARYCMEGTQMENQIPFVL